ncbi:MAG TPA: amino acid adenylation domain-containing protein, partial [Candidatus Kapabacteria bacterium]|nr:amino acid adenylation domain-containing protein [Candidatus Kapabacteria bacterium]
MTNYMHKENIEDVYPLSDIQLGMIYYSLKAPDTAVYHNQMVFQRKDRDFEPEVFKKAMLLMVKKHSILRTGFNIENSKKPLQIVFKNINPDILHHDLSQMVKEQQENHIKSFLMQDRKKPFDLTTPGLLWKLRTFALGDDNICFIWICHHAITDGWSTASLLTELNNTYIKLKSNSHYVPQKLKSSYKEFILQQRLEKKNEKTIQYWRNELTGYKRLNFPGVINSKHIAAKKMEYSKDLGNEFREKLNKIAVKYNISFKNLCFSAYIYMLSMLSYDGEVVAGLVTHNRPVCEDGDKIIGCFLNTVPFRIQIPYSLTWADYINLMNKKLVELAYYNNLPLPEITKIIGEESIEQNPIFDTFFNFMDFHIYHQLISLGDAETGQKENESMLSINSFEETNISFNFDVTAFSKNFSIRLTYSNTLLSNEFAERLAGYFVEVLNKFIHDPERIIIREELMSEIEKRKLLLEFNQTNTEYPKDKTIHQLFEEQALKTPDYIAIVGDAGVKEKKGRREEEKNVGAGPRACPVNLTYRQLNEESDRLAGILIEKGVLPDTIVGIIMERSVEMIIGIFGILKSSGAYLPIEPEYPKERIDFMLKDSGAKLLITTNDIESEKVRSWKGEKYYIEVLSCSSYPLTFLPLCLQNPSNLAYVIYTSGSTGWPKGVIVEHRGVMNYIKWAERFYLQGKSFDFAFYSSLAFDLTVTSIYVPLISGNKIVVYPNDEKEFVISKILREDRVQVIKLTPTHLKMVMNMFPGDVKNIKKLIVGGEDLAVELACEIHRLFKGNIEIYNEYGPTETTVGCMIHKFDPSADCRQSVPIGVPITNTNIYILDYYQCPIVAGVAGELYVSGEGLARGYLNKPELSAEKFIHFHHSSFDIPRIHHSKLYKTGDLAMWLPDGKVEFLGRIDHQVKIRGFRIEPGEIERQLLSHDGIKASAVITIVEKDENYLCAYFTSDEKIEIPKLRDNLAKKLPNYMIPSYFIQIESIPLTTSGKIDRNALISIGHKQDAEIEFVAPQNETEKIIASVWKEVLGVEQVGIYDNFFHIGGNSLNLVTLSSKLNTALGTNIPIAKLFEYVTISTFARYFTGKETERSFPRINRTVEVNEIAIIGMAGRFPGAKNIDEFWDNLKNGIESIKFLTDDEFKELDPELLKNPNFVKVKGGVLENKDCFDAAFFDYTVMDARVMDPQTRIFHECTYEALENAGYVADTYDGIIGLYAGASPSSTWEALIHFSGMTEELGEFFASQLAGRDFLCTRVAYKLDLKGPAINIQTACSTSLVAVHMACRAILHGECDMALAGGISITHMEKNGYVYQEGMIFSPDGHCRAFDADARGTVNGNGVGIIALKSLKKALEEGDYIHAIIRGTAVNNDGINKAGYTAPSVKGQVAVIQAALQLAQVDPETISYVETHGTGTILGDPIEIEALKQAYNTDKRQYCAIGSVKTNIGHLDAAAGIAGLIKTVLALKNKLLPPSLHYKKNNPKIDFENCPFYVNATLKEWKNEGRPRLAGVSSFGIGGTNAHVILEEAQEIKPRENNKNIHLILLAARTESALEKITRNLVEYLQKNSETNLSDVAYTLQVGRKIFEYKRMMVCDEINGAVDALSFILPGKMKTFFSKDKKTPVILM